MASGLIVLDANYFDLVSLVELRFLLIGCQQEKNVPLMQVKVHGDSMVTCMHQPLPLH